MVDAIDCPRCSGHLSTVTEIMLHCDECSRWWRKHVKMECYFGYPVAVVEGIIGTINDVGKEVFVGFKWTYLSQV